MDEPGVEVGTSGLLAGDLESLLLNLLALELDGRSDLLGLFLNGKDRESRREHGRGAVDHLCGFKKGENEGVGVKERGKKGDG